MKGGQRRDIMSVESFQGVGGERESEKKREKGNHVVFRMTAM